MLEVLILVLLLFMLALLVGFSVQHATQSASLDLGNYTRAYRCKRCNAIYSRDQKICSICGYEHIGMMSNEVGKWHCEISKLRLVYYWERKDDQKKTKDSNRDGIL